MIVCEHCGGVDGYHEWDCARPAEPYGVIIAPESLPTHESDAAAREAATRPAASFIDVDHGPCSREHERLRGQWAVAEKDVHRLNGELEQMRERRRQEHQDASVMYRILDQMFSDQSWTERFTIRPVPWHERTVEVARDVKSAEEIERWRAEFADVVRRATDRGADYYDHDEEAAG